MRRSTARTPGFFANFCAIAGDLIGTTSSSERLTAHPAGSTAAPLGYYEYLPPGYGEGEPSPLLVFLHGFGESGDGSADSWAICCSPASPS